MKKILALLFIGMLALAPIGCGDGEYVEPEPVEEVQLDGVPALPGDEEGEE